MSVRHEICFKYGLFLALIVHGICHGICHGLASEPTEEPEDIVSMFIASDVVIVGSVNKTTSNKLFDTCAEIETFDSLKGYPEAPLVACRNALKADDMILVGEKEEKFIMFLSSNVSVDAESGHKYYQMTLPPRSYTFEDVVDIESYLADPSVAQPPAIKVVGKTMINESFGDSVDVTCPFSGFPPPKVQWRRHGSVLKSSDDIKIESNETASVLKFAGLHVDNIGEYQCIVYNVLGFDNVTFRVDSYKMHAIPCPLPNNYCFGKGICYISGGMKFCECQIGYAGHRCQFAGGESNQPTFKPDESQKSVQTLMLIISIAVVTTGAIVFIYAAIKGLFVGAKYKKIRPDGLTQPPSENMIEVQASASQLNSETKGSASHTAIDIPVEDAQIKSCPGMNRDRLDGTSTPSSNFGDGIWNLRSYKFDGADDDQSRNFSTFPHRESIKNYRHENSKMRASSVGGVVESSGSGEIVPIKISII